MRTEAERARIVAESPLPGTQVSEVGAQARSDGLADLGLATTLSLEERHVPAIKLEIAIGEVVMRTDTAIGGEQKSRVIRAVRAS